MKIKNKIFVISILLLFFMTMSLVSASTSTEDNLTITDSDTDKINDVNLQSTHSSSNDHDLKTNNNVESDDIVINQENYKTYFDDNNALKEDFSGKILTFDGQFTEKGVLTINQENTKIKGQNTLFNNTVFSVTAPNVILANLNFYLNESFIDNENAGIYIEADNVTLYNINMNYDTPKDIDVIGVYSCYNTGFNLINSTVNYIGHAFNGGVFNDCHNYGVLLLYSDDALISGNNFNSTLPLREVDWSQGIYGGVGMDKVAAFAAGNSEHLQFIENNVYSTVNNGGYADNRYPTLSSVLIYACDNSTIDKNNIKVEDFYTRRNQANYIYALDIYRLNDVTVIGNTIDVFTYGGHDYMGTAYPIQVTGPAYNIKIANNWLRSVSNGPNIGIYSQNYYGATQLDVINNFINITGKAGTHMWALVAGIEVQDSDDRILNNTIIVDTVGGYKTNDRVYGISYSQNTQGNHTYIIKFNNVTTPGPTAVNLNQGLESITQDTQVMYNILNTRVGEGGDKAVTIGGKGENNIIRYNTNGRDTIRHMSDNDLPDWLKKYNNTQRRKNIPNLSWINTGEGEGTGSSNTNTNTNGNSFNGEGEGTGLSNNLGNGNSFNGNGHGFGLNIKNKINGTNANPSKSNATNGDKNSTKYTHGKSSLHIATAQSSAGSGSKSSTNGKTKKRAYDVSKKLKQINKDNTYILSLLGLLLIFLLLIVGYRKKNPE